MSTEYNKILDDKTLIEFIKKHTEANLTENKKDAIFYKIRSKYLEAENTALNETIDSIYARIEALEKPIIALKAKNEKLMEEKKELLETITNLKSEVNSLYYRLDQKH